MLAEQFCIYGDIDKLELKDVFYVKVRLFQKQTTIFLKLRLHGVVYTFFSELSLLRHVDVRFYF